MNRVHPLIHLADTIPLDGDPLQKIRDTFERIVRPMSSFSTAYIELVSACLLAEYILLKRQQARQSIFPIPKSTRKPITVRAKTLKLK